MFTSVKIINFTNVKKHIMTDTHLFSERLLKIFETYSISSTQFADSIGVQRSTLSHLLSNRNKPSLELLLKITEHYPDLNLYWLSNGSQEMMLGSENNNHQSIIKNDSFSSKEVNVLNVESEKINYNKKDEEVSEIDYIVVFYKNGTFKRFNEL